MPKTEIGKLSDELHEAKTLVRLLREEVAGLKKRLEELRAENEQLLIREKWCNKSNVRLRDGQYRAQMLMHSLIDMALFKQEEEDKDG